MLCRRRRRGDDEPGADPHQQGDGAVARPNRHDLAGSAETGQPRCLQQAERRLCHKHTYGGDCYNYALLAAGHVDIVLEDGLATHDIMGVVEVIRAAGGIVTDKRGAAVTMQGTDSLLAASTPELHAAALALAGKSG